VQIIIELLEIPPTSRTKQASRTHYTRHLHHTKRRRRDGTRVIGEDRWGVWNYRGFTMDRNHVHWNRHGTVFRPSATRKKLRLDLYSSMMHFSLKSPLLHCFPQILRSSRKIRPATRCARDLQGILEAGNKSDIV
jgi:hypothetical protein